MANVSQGDSSSLQIVLERVDPARNIARYCVLSIEPTLFAKHTLIRRWGRIGCLALLWQILFEVSSEGSPAMGHR
jgi:WGR domain